MMRYGKRLELRLELAHEDGRGRRDRRSCSAYCGRPLSHVGKCDDELRREVTRNVDLRKIEVRYNALEVGTDSAE